MTQLERRLGIAINYRGGAFHVIGDEAAVQAAGEVLRTMYAETRGAVLTPARVHLLLQGAQMTPAEDEQSEPPETEDVQIKTRRAVIKGRGHNQRRYLQNILSYDINFGIGPAGTG